MRRLALLLALCQPLGAQSLRELGDQRGVAIGAAVDPSRFSETAYSTTLSREFSHLFARS